MKSAVDYIFNHTLSLILKLCDHTRDLKEGFAPYAEEVCKIMVPHLKFLFHEMVRACAAESLPLLLECVKDSNVAAVDRMWEMIRLHLLEAINIEPDSDIHVSNILQS